MQKDGEYSDQLLMRALALKLGFNYTIHTLKTEIKADGTVHKVDTEDIQIFNEPKEDFKMVHISFHLNTHYNSVVSLEKKCEEKF